MNMGFDILIFSLRKLTFVATTIFLLSIIKPSQLQQHRIVGGQEAAPGQFPYLVFLYSFFANDSMNSSSTCTASVLSQRWILTAGHCMEKDVQKLIRINTWYAVNLTDVEDVKHNPFNYDRIQECIPHPKYEIKTVIFKNLTGLLRIYDIALLKTRKNIILDQQVKPVVLSLSKTLSGECLAVGYGITSPPGSNMTPEVSTKLLYTKLDYQPPDKILLELLGENIKYFIAGSVSSDRHPSLGDSGGPLICNGKSLGVTSLLFMSKVLAGKVGIVYTSASYFKDWIEKTTGLKPFEKQQQEIKDTPITKTPQSCGNNHEHSILCFVATAYLSYIML